jgi:hypothetical protein
MLEEYQFMIDHNLIGSPFCVPQLVFWCLPSGSRPKGNQVILIEKFAATPIDGNIIPGACDTHCTTACLTERQCVLCYSVCCVARCCPSICAGCLLSQGQVLVAGGAVHIARGMRPTCQ